MPLGTIFSILSIALSKSIESASDPSNPLPKTELHLCFIYSMQISSIHPSITQAQVPGKVSENRRSRSINNWTFSVISLFRGFSVDESTFSKGQKILPSDSFWLLVIHLEIGSAKCLEEQKGFLRMWEVATILNYRCTCGHEMLH